MILTPEEEKSLHSGMASLLAFSRRFEAWIGEGGDNRILEVGDLLPLIGRTMNEFRPLANSGKIKPWANDERSGE